MAAFGEMGADPAAEAARQVLSWLGRTELLSRDLHFDGGDLQFTG